MKELRLPRPLVMKLLTLAQDADGGILRGVIGARDGEPDHIETIDAGSATLFDFPQDAFHAAVAKLSANGRLLHAVFESRNERMQPSVEDLSRLAIQGLLYLLVSLGTRGVLELQGWMLVDGQAVPVEIGIREID